MLDTMSAGDEWQVYRQVLASTPNEITREEYRP